MTKLPYTLDDVSEVQEEVAAALAHLTAAVKSLRSCVNPELPVSKQPFMLTMKELKNYTDDIAERAGKVAKEAALLAERHAGIVEAKKARE